MKFLFVKNISVLCISKKFLLSNLPALLINMSIEGVDSNILSNIVLFSIYKGPVPSPDETLVTPFSLILILKREGFLKDLFSIKFIKEIFSYSMWIFIFALVSIFQWKAGHWVLGRVCTPEVLTIYGIGIVLGTYYGAFSTAISSVFLPRATKMSVDNASGEELTDMMIKIGRLSFIILMFILTAFTLFGRQFVFLWVGGELGADGSFQSWLIALMIMVNTPGSWGYVYSPLLHAKWHGCTPTDLVFPFFL